MMLLKEAQSTSIIGGYNNVAGGYGTKSIHQGTRGYEGSGIRDLGVKISGSGSD